MDSGNSDSFQSSNGGDEEYTSCGGGGGGGDIISAFNKPAATRVGGLIYNPPPHHSTNQPMFDPIISTYKNLENNMLHNNNPDMTWSGTLRSDPNCTETSNKISSHQLFTIENSKLASSSPSVAKTMHTNSRTSSSLPLTDHHQTHGLPSVRIPNPKKRPRASRRAPTTVLATDTTNFRAMVQEFTGIPEPPFTSSSSSSSSSLFSRNSRLDNLFATSSSMRSNPLDYNSMSLSSQPPPYLRMPFPHKVQPALSPTSSMFAASMLDSSHTNVDDHSYQRLQTSNFFTMQNPILASLLQSNHPKPTFSDHPSIFDSRTHHGSMQIQSSNGVLDEFGGLGQGPVDNNGNLDALPGLVSAYPERCGGGTGVANDGGPDQGSSFGNNNGSSHDDFPRNVANGKRVKGMMEDGARNEGMMETWICSSSEL